MPILVRGAVAALVMAFKQPPEVECRVASPSCACATLVVDAWP